MSELGVPFASRYGSDTFLTVLNSFLVEGCPRGVFLFLHDTRPFQVSNLTIRLAHVRERMAHEHASTERWRRDCDTFP